MTVSGRSEPYVFGGRVMLPVDRMIAALNLIALQAGRRDGIEPPIVVWQPTRRRRRVWL